MNHCNVSPPPFTMTSCFGCVCVLQVPDKGVTANFEIFVNGKLLHSKQTLNEGFLDNAYKVGGQLFVASVHSLNTHSPTQSRLTILHGSVKSFFEALLRQAASKWCVAWLCEFFFWRNAGNGMLHLHLPESLPAGKATESSVFTKNGCCLSVQHDVVFQLWPRMEAASFPSYLDQIY